MILRRWMVLPDIHHPVHDVAAMRCVYKACALIRPYGVGFIGDVFENESASGYQWKSRKKPEFDWLRPIIDKEIDHCNKFMDFHDEQLHQCGVTEKFYIQGNHEERHDRMVKDQPMLADLVNSQGRVGYGWKELIGIDERGYTYLPYGEIHNIGKLKLYHGQFFGGVHHAKAHLLKMGVSVMYGHYHDVQQYSITHQDGPKSAWCIGCLKSLRNEDNKWLQGRPTNWANAFAIVDEYAGGNFGVNVIWIINGRCVVDGTFIDGNKEKLKIP